MLRVPRMMNMTPQELNSYIVQSHGSQQSDYLYVNHSSAGPVGPYAHHHPLSVGSGGCASSQQSSDDDLTFYSNSASVTHPSATSHSLPPQQPYVGSDSGNVTTSLYGLVTGNPSCFTATPISSPVPQQQQQPHPHPPQQPHYSPHHLHIPQQSTSGGVTTHPHHHLHHHHHQQEGASRSSQHPSSSTSSSQSQQSYSQVSGTSGLIGGPSGASITMADVSSPSPYLHHTNQHHKQYQTHHPSSSHRKRKSPVPRVESEPDDDSETCSSRRTATPTDESSKKQNHSEIEKRRRDKMNLYITELSGMVPMCSAMSRKLDKLTVLRMAVQHMKTLRGSRIHSYTEGHYKPSFLTDTELKRLILQSAEGFLFVVGCDRGRLLYVSESVSQVLNYTQSELLGQSWFDILHPKDVAKVKEQLSSSDLAPRERLIDAKTMLPVKGNVPQKANRLCPGARRSFFCRMKCKNAPLIKEEVDSSSSSGCHRRKKASNSERKYSVIHCTGYLKSWAKIGMEDCEGEADDPCNLSCLVAVGRILNPISTPSSNPSHRPVTFISRHAIDGKFLFVDQRTTLVVGFLPQELLGTSVYEYFHQDDIQLLAEVHKHVLLTSEPITTQMYRFRTRNGSFIKLVSSWKAFRNPWTRETECIIAKNTLAPDCGDIGENRTTRSDPFNNPSEFDFFSGNGNGGNTMGNREIQRLMNLEVPFRKIGEQIAEEIIDSQRRSDSSSSNSPVSNVDSSGLQIVRVPSTPPLDVTLPQMLSPSENGSSVLLSQSQHSSQESSPSNAAAVPQRHSGLNVSACSPPNGDTTAGSSSTGLSGSSQSEGAAEGLTLSSRTNDPIIGASGPTITIPTGTTTTYRLIRTNGNNAVLPTTRNTPNVLNNETDEEMLYIIGGDSVLPESPHQTTSGDGNDEAAMAVIMSLLEADAGLGGPVDFSGLPWPLP